MNQQFTEYLKKGEIAKFGQAVAEFHKTLTCNCFFSKLNKNYFEEQLKLIKRYKDDENDFWFNLSKGFILLKCNKQKEAYIYLSKAISIDVTNDLPHSLRSSIDSPINMMSKEDANIAVVLNPTARNYFLLTTHYEKTNKEEDSKQAIIYYEKAIKLNRKFACAHFNMASQLRKIENYDRAILEYKHCIQIDPNHWGAYHNLWRVLDTKKEYKEAYRIANLGHKLHQDDIDYDYDLGIASLRLNMYEEAIKFLEKYLLIKKDSKSAKEHLEIAKKDQPYNALLQKAIDTFNEENYQDSIQLFEEYLENFKPLNQYHTLKAENTLREAKKKLLELPLTKAMRVYNKKNYLEAIQLFEEYLEILEKDSIKKASYLQLSGIEKKLSLRTISPRPLSDAEIDAYFNCMLKCHDENIEINENNLLYKRIYKLRNTYHALIDTEDECEITEDEKNATKLMKYEVNHTIGFGKYEGKKLSTIVETDPSYVLWCVINLHHFSIPKILFFDKKLKSESEYILALEYNIIKNILIEEWAEKEKEYEYDEYDEYDDNDYMSSSEIQRDFERSMDEETDGAWRDD